MKKNQKEWQEVRLGDISDINSNILQKSDNYTYINYLDTGNITKGIIDNIQKIPIYDIPSRAKRKVDIGDIIYSTVRPIQKHYGIIKNYIDNMIVSTGFITIKVKEYIADKYFIYYNIIQDNITNYLQMIAEQSVSTYPSIKPSDLSNMIIKLPPLEEQKKIASILSSLDDKIELNNRMNKILEEMAQTIFKEWFVNFNFPSEEGKPYKDSGGKMIESELGAIPEGWKVDSLSNVANFLNGLAMQKFRNKDNNFIYVLKIKELRQGFTDINSDKVRIDIDKDYIVNNGDIIFSWSGTLMTDIWCGGIAGLNQHLFKVTSDKFEKWFYYFWIKKHLENFILIARDKTTTMGHIKREHLDKALVLIPNTKLLNKANDIFNPIIEQIINLRIENQKLASIRDTLLPKLMSGEIRVK